MPYGCSFICSKFKTLWLLQVLTVLELMAFTSCHTLIVVACSVIFATTQVGELHIEVFVIACTGILEKLFK